MLKIFLEFLRFHFRFKPAFILNTLAAFIIVNGFWIVASHWLFIFRPYLNYDYLPAILLASVSVLASFAVFILIYLQEIFISNALVFHFDGFSGLFSAKEFARELNLLEFIKIQDLVLFLSFSIVALAVARVLKGRTNLVAAMIVLVLAISADQLNGSSYLIKSDDQLIEGNVAGSSALNIFMSLREVNVPKKEAVFLPNEEIVLSKTEVIEWAKNNPAKSVLFVIVESYGVNDSEQANQWLYRQLVSPEAREDYDVEYGTARFSGATTASELRHLCALGGTYNAILTPDKLGNCIPEAFAKLDYPVIGTHGFSENMFRRGDWWKTIGLQEILFVNEFDAMKAPYCGSGMYGICDEFIIDYLGHRMTEQRGFYYQLTLNTHFPVVKMDIPEDLAAICAEDHMSEQVCMLNARIGLYFRKLSAVLSTVPDRPLVFVVGDHAPPFTNQASRTFSADKTPYFVLRPK